MKPLKKVVFLDRDGVINYDSPEYIKNRSEFKFIPGSIEAVEELTRNGFTSIVISNQSALSRKLVTPEELNDIHKMMKQAIASAGGRITEIFFCPHMPGDGCQCRKPGPGLIFRAQRKYNIDLAGAVMVGDSTRDIACARNAGCGAAVLVESGYEFVDLNLLRKSELVPDHVARNLREAAKWVIERSF
jgi:D-glycero-D-manno-heptose 1,7-bisphosphate phosphatase